MFPACKNAGNMPLMPAKCFDKIGKNQVENISPIKIAFIDFVILLFDDRNYASPSKNPHFNIAIIVHLLQ